MRLSTGCRRDRLNRELTRENCTVLTAGRSELDLTDQARTRAWIADNRPDGSATGGEWRTTPLWGLRLMRQFLDGQALLLHDGRAGSVTDAILLHGGEAKRARDAFAALADAQRRVLVDFVESR